MMRSGVQKRKNGGGLVSKEREEIFQREGLISVIIDFNLSSTFGHLSGGPRKLGGCVTFEGLA